MKTFTINHISTARNAGIAREHDLCAYMGIERTAHDSTDYRTSSDICINEYHSTDYRTSSDICINEYHISVKASGFTLMSGNMCEGEDSFDGIWNVYKRNTHSNEFAYVTEDYTVYMMNLVEFERFVRAFCKTERESEKNGGKMKIRCRKESVKMRAWFAACMA